VHRQKIIFGSVLESAVEVSWSEIYGRISLTILNDPASAGTPEEVDAHLQLSNILFIDRTVRLEDSLPCDPNDCNAPVEANAFG
jgi:hypothetical protein